MFLGSSNSTVILSDEVLGAMALASRTLCEVLGLGLGPKVLDNRLPHNNFTFCNYSMK